MQLFERTMVAIEEDFLGGKKFVEKVVMKSTGGPDEVAEEGALT